jgi:hypothetical protein
MGMADEDDDAITTSRIISVLAGCDRRDRWWLAPSTSLVSMFARSYLDLRDVVTDPSADVIEMNVLCAIGTVTIVVPEGTDVTLSGTSLLASSGSLVEQGSGLSMLPRIVITATTVLGRMQVQTTPVAKKIRRKRGKGARTPIVFQDDPSLRSGDVVDEIGTRPVAASLEDEPFAPDEARGFGDLDDPFGDDPLDDELAVGGIGGAPPSSTVG